MPKHVGVFVLIVLYYEIHLLENILTECFICISTGTKDSSSFVVSGQVLLPEFLHMKHVINYSFVSVCWFDPAVFVLRSGHCSTGFIN